jgi:hypothetical protein
MKAIRQIVDFLRGRDELSRSDLVGLVEMGILSWEDLGEGHTSDEPSSVVRAGLGSDVPNNAVDWDLDVPGAVTTGKRAGAGRKGRGVLRKGPVLEVSELCGRLADQFEAWRADLDGLLRVGRRLSACATWEEAAVAIRNAGQDEVFRAVCEGLEHRDPTLKALLHAIDMNRYGDIVAEAGVHGPAANAFRAVLAAISHEELGKHAWLLKNKEVGDVFNLRAAQFSLCRAWLHLHREKPELHARACRRDRVSMRNL